MWKLLFAILFIGGARASIDSILAGANENAVKNQRFSSHINSETGERMKKEELDLMMTAEQRKAIFGDSGKRGGFLKRRNFQTKVGHWPNAELVYELNAFANHAQTAQRIKDAVDGISAVTCVTFREKRSNDYNFVSFVQKDGCWSQVGMSSGRQELSLGSAGCTGVGTIQHELLHALGFLHEQSRPDRDDYLTILENNVQSNMLHNFRKANSGGWEAFKSPYDYRSLMHYSKSAFATRYGDVTMRTKDRAFQDIIGQVRELSFDDILQINRAYKCEDRCSNKPSCSSSAIVMADCTCKCKGSGSTKLVDCTPDTDGNQQRTTTSGYDRTTPDTDGGKTGEYVLRMETADVDYAGTAGLKNVVVALYWADDEEVKETFDYLTADRGEVKEFPMPIVVERGAPSYMGVWTNEEDTDGWIIEQITDSWGNTFECSGGDIWEGRCIIDTGDENYSDGYTVWSRTGCKTPSETTSGIPCQHWTMDHPHQKNEASNSQPDMWKQVNGDTCQDPNSNSGFLWCYTMDSDVKWDKCDQSYYNCRQN